MKPSASESPKHFAIKQAILNACADFGFGAKAEASGRGWRADVIVSTPGRSVAFEVQLSPQGLTRTLERQARFWRSGVVGCWLFLEGKKLKDLNSERPDLPLFFVGQGRGGEFTVALGDRRVLTLSEFVGEYSRGRIRFCEDAVSAPTQYLQLRFYELPCWKCGKMNHPYMLGRQFKASCNAVAHPKESLWEDTKSEYRPDVVFAAKRFASQYDAKPLMLPTVARRSSRTVGHEYLSFGCHACDAIFGDWFIHEAEIEIAYGGAIAEAHISLAMSNVFSKPIPHWCYPQDGSYCVASAASPLNAHEARPGDHNAAP
jgi:hypothetical protein